MSDKYKCLFSSMKLTIMNHYSRLKADIIEVCECLRAWYGRPQLEDNGNSNDSENDDDEIDS